MNRARARKRYAAPVLKSLTYEQARDRLESQELKKKFSEQLPVMLLEAVLLGLPVLVALSAIDPSGFLLHKVLLSPRLPFWAGWAIVCFCLGLSSEELLKRCGRGSDLQKPRPAFFAMLGLINCASIIGLFFIAGTGMTGF